MSWSVVGGIVPKDQVLSTLAEHRQRQEEQRHISEAKDHIDAAMRAARILLEAIDTDMVSVTLSGHYPDEKFPIPSININVNGVKANRET